MYTVDQQAALFPWPVEEMLDFAPFECLVCFPVWFSGKGSPQETSQGRYLTFGRGGLLPFAEQCSTPFEVKDSFFFSVWVAKSLPKGGGGGGGGGGRLASNAVVGRKSLYFALFGGEEEGLWGSDAFAEALRRLGGVPLGSRSEPSRSQLFFFWESIRGSLKEPHFATHLKHAAFSRIKGNHH